MRRSAGRLDPRSKEKSGCTGEPPGARGVGPGPASRGLQPPSQSAPSRVLGRLSQHALMTTGRRLPGTRQGPCLAAVLLSGSWGLSGGGQDARPISSRQHLTPQHPDWRRQLRAGATAVTEKPDQRASHPDSGPASPCPGRGASRPRGPQGAHLERGWTVAPLPGRCGRAWQTLGVCFPRRVAGRLPSWPDSARVPPHPWPGRTAG